MTSTTKEHPALLRTVAPTIEPVTLAQARRKVQVAASQTGHDPDLNDLIESARDIFESDTSKVCTTATYTHTTRDFTQLRLEVSPVQSISSVKCYDTGNDQQTLSSSIYQLDKANQCVRLAYNQSWPALADRWDAVEVTFVAGHTTAALVPGRWRSAILLMIGHLFENVDDYEAFSPDKTQYENLIAQVKRPTYP